LQSLRPVAIVELGSIEGKTFLEQQTTLELRHSDTNTTTDIAPCISVCILFHSFHNPISRINRRPATDDFTMDCCISSICGAGRVLRFHPMAMLFLGCELLGRTWSPMRRLGKRLHKHHSHLYLPTFAGIPRSVFSDGPIQPISRPRTRTSRDSELRQAFAGRRLPIRRSKAPSHRRSDSSS